MKNKTRAFVAVMMVALLCLVFAGCSLVSVNEEKDMAQVVAKVGDVEILKEEFVEMFDYQLSMYTMYGLDPTQNPEELTTFQDDMLNAVVAGYILDYKAKEQGISGLTAEELDEVKASAADDLGYLDEMVATQLESELALDATLDRDARSAELFDEIVLSYTGEALARSEFEAWAVDQLTKNALRTKVQDSFYATVSVSDEEVAAYFDELVASDTTTYTDAPASYKAAQEYYEKYGGDIVAYAPENYIRVKHILLVPEEEIGTEYTDLQTEMTALSEELGKLTVEDETANAARIAEIKEEYANKKTESNRLYDAHFDGIREEADAVYARLQAGESFDTVMMDATMDANFTDFDVFLQKGVLMGEFEGEDADWSDAVKKATFALTEKGAYTAVIEDDSGCHIIQYVGDEPAGARKLADYMDAAKEIVLADKQEQEWNALMDEWLADTTLVTLYADRIRDVNGAVG